MKMALAMTAFNAFTKADITISNHKSCDQLLDCGVIPIVYNYSLTLLIKVVVWLQL
jgi:hypothetical protein